MNNWTCGLKDGFSLVLAFFWVLVKNVSWLCFNMKWTILEHVFGPSLCTDSNLPGMLGTLKLLSINSVDLNNIGRSWTVTWYFRCKFGRFFIVWDPEKKHGLHIIRININHEVEVPHSKKHPLGIVCSGEAHWRATRVSWYRVWTLKHKWQSPIHCRGPTTTPVGVSRISAFGLRDCRPPLPCRYATWRCHVKTAFWARKWWKGIKFSGTVIWEVGEHVWRGHFEFLDFLLSGTQNLQVRVPKQTISMIFWRTAVWIVFWWFIHCGLEVVFRLPPSTERPTSMKSLKRCSGESINESGGGAKTTAETGNRMGL